ncbi:MAG TPA: ABC transporter permease [Candidatus Aminicenantes bacterium]|nr:ABC transporter permease [Candidatus Aminicenantes bacterium]HRY64828.1 ABC transporter permease [Candidatus Aminicenantes bacterium]HRZ71741.1 ABC transporter permease [Candidatus Aminicenantes bacterium]
MRRLLLVLRNDVRRHLKSPAAILIYIAIPMVMTALIGIIFAPRTEESTLPPIRVVLVDHDKNLASRLLLGAFDADEVKKMLEVTVSDEAEGRRRMEKGQASAIVIIPEKFTLDLLDARTTVLTVVKNPAEQFLPDVVEEFMNTMAVMLSGAVQAFAAEARGIRAMLDAPVESIPWEALGPELGRAQKKIVAVRKYLDPLLIGIKAEEAKAAGAKTLFTQRDLFSIMLPGMAIMFLLFIVQTLMRDIISERQDGKLRRMMTTPLRPLELVGARLAGGWVMGLAILMVMVALGSLIFRAEWGNLGYFLLLAAAASFWTAAFFGFFSALVKNRNQAGALGAPIILAFSLFGGSMMNPEAMPKAFKAVGILTPNRWFIDGAALVRDGRFPLAPLAVLTVSGIVLTALAVPALRRKTLV